VRWLRRLDPAAPDWLEGYGRKFASLRCPDLSWSRRDQFNWLGWGDRRNGMLEDDLDATSPYKHYREGVELPDLALQPYAVDEKHRHIKFVVAKMPQEGVLDGRCPWCGHVRTPIGHPCKDAASYRTAAAASYRQLINGSWGALAPLPRLSP
jgi:hypothetical protein